jgi:hypothetical protein
MSKLRVNTVVNRTNTDKVIFPYGIGVTNGIICSGIISATSFVGSGASLTGVPGIIVLQDPAGNNTLTGITTLRVGTGMTLTSPSPGIASFRSTGYLENLRVVGFASFGVTGLTTLGFNEGQIRSQASQSLISHYFNNSNQLTTQLAADYPGSFAFADNDNQAYVATDSVWTMLAKGNHTGIITASGGFVATGSALGFTGPLNSTGVSTAAFLQATNINVSGAATVGTSLTVTQDLKVSRHTILSGITTVTNIVVSQSFTGNINSSGVSSIAQLEATTVDVSGIVTASTFTGPLVGSVNGNLIGEINSTGISTIGRLQVTSINQSSGISTIPQLKGSTISITGVATASQFSGNSTGLTGSPDISVGFTTSKTILPETDNSYDLGSSGVRWANIYSADMHFSNEGSSNSVDGTWGSWTLQEGEDNIFMLNNRTGKRYKINLTEVD